MSNPTVIITTFQKFSLFRMFHIPLQLWPYFHSSWCLPRDPFYPHCRKRVKQSLVIKSRTLDWSVIHDSSLWLLSNFFLFSVELLINIQIICHFDQSHKIFRTEYRFVSSSPQVYSSCPKITTKENYISTRKTRLKFGPSVIQDCITFQNLWSRAKLQFWFQIL